MKSWYNVGVSLTICYQKQFVNVKIHLLLTHNVVLAYFTNSIKQNSLLSSIQHRLFWHVFWGVINVQKILSTICILIIWSFQEQFWYVFEDHPWTQMMTSTFDIEMATDLNEQDWNVYLALFFSKWWQAYLTLKRF